MTEWFNGRFWREWVIGRKNKPSEADGEEEHLSRSSEEARLDTLRLNEIGVAEVAEFRASLVEKKLQEKRINNILGVLSKPLRYAVDVEVIDRTCRKIGLLKSSVPRSCAGTSRVRAHPSRLRRRRARVVCGGCLAGEAGLRVGEVKALRWREDVDLVAGTITVNQQTRHGVPGRRRAARGARCR